MASPSSPILRSWWQLGMALGKRALNTLYPERCFGCGGWFEGRASESGGSDLRRWLCGGCVEDLPRIYGAACQVCGEPYDGELDHAFRCWNCEGREFAFESAHSAYQAEGLVRDLVHRFKYQGHYHLRGLMAALLEPSLSTPQLVQETLSDWVLVPVPLHRWRQMTRSYNQAWEICLALAKNTGLTAANPLRRTRRTRPQAGLDRSRRMANLEGAFILQAARAAPSLVGRSVLLVDDVLTTGSTCHECARVLREEGGVEKVVVITVARG
jgi:competence protein ComFC